VEENVEKVRKIFNEDRLTG